MPFEQSLDVFGLICKVPVHRKGSVLCETFDCNYVALPNVRLVMLHLVVERVVDCYGRPRRLVDPVHVLLKGRPVVVTVLVVLGHEDVGVDHLVLVSRWSHACGVCSFAYQQSVDQVAQRSQFEQRLAQRYPPVRVAQSCARRHPLGPVHRHARASEDVVEEDGIVQHEPIVHAHVQVVRCEQSIQVHDLDGIRKLRKFSLRNTSKFF